MTLTVIGFDLFGTLIQAKGDHAVCLKSVHRELTEHGIKIPIDLFLETYHEVHANNRVLRTVINKEISNRIEICEILKRFGYNIDANSPLIQDAVTAYFSVWTVSTLKGVETTLKSLFNRFKIGLITNFTDSTYVYKCLKNLHLLDLFDYVVISEEIGWRKPNSRIFQKLLHLSMAEADQVLFVGDDVNSDIAGAKDLGIKSVLLAKESNRKAEYLVQPDFIISSINELNEVIAIIMRR